MFLKENELEIGDLRISGKINTDHNKISAKWIKIRILVSKILGTCQNNKILLVGEQSNRN